MSGEMDPKLKAEYATHANAMIAKMERREREAQAATEDPRLSLLLEGAHQVVTSGHGVHCFSVRNPYHASEPRCDCGFDVLREALKLGGGQ